MLLYINNILIDIYKYKLSRQNHVVQLKLKLKKNKTTEEYTLTNFEFKGVKFTDTFCLNTMNSSLLISEVENPQYFSKARYTAVKD